MINSVIPIFFKNMNLLNNVSYLYYLHKNIKYLRDKANTKDLQISTLRTTKRC